ncbi:MAG: ABC transporter ATP-binding protein [Planctomycetes bacterium]|nr:ABC transporter ATP-binding protein [Planctomycetota bacterium]
MANVISTDRLTKFYGEKRAVDALSLNVPEGSVYALLGRNGAGKSTTIRMLTGIVQPDFGSATIFGEDVSSLSPETKARVAWAAEGHPLYRWMRVGQMARFASAFHSNWNEDLVRQILDHFEIPLKKRIFQLSYGQRAQVSLALAVAPDPKLLILDDPTLGLDTVVRRDFLESMIQIIQRDGRTILFSSHILSDVDRVADRIGILVDGVLRADCPIDHFRDAIRKVVVEFDDPPKALPDCRGLVSTRIVGTRIELAFVDFGDEQRSALEKIGAKSIEVLDLNLEDAFVEYTRGRKGTLPLFNREVAHVG